MTDDKNPLRDAIARLRDNAAWLVDRASHKGDYAAIPQDHIDGLRDAVRDFDRGVGPQPDTYVTKIAREALNVWDACPDNRAHTLAETKAVVDALRGMLGTPSAVQTSPDVRRDALEEAAREADAAAEEARKGCPMSAMHRGAFSTAQAIAAAIRARAALTRSDQ